VRGGSTPPSRTMMDEADRVHDLLHL